LGLDISCEISIIIPAYNEQERLGPTLDRILDFIQRENWRAEVIVVDGASQDRTVDIVRGYAQNPGIVRLIRNAANRGKGYCVRKGVMQARGRIILFTDAELSSPIEEAPKLLQALGAGADIAIGSRWLHSASQTQRQSPARQVLGRAFNLLVRMVLRLDFKDTQCGFKAFRRNAARAVFSNQRIEQWGFDPEILFLARQAGFKVAEIPVSWAHDNRTRIQPIADGSRMVGEILRIRWYSMRGKYRESFRGSISPTAAENPAAPSLAESQAGD
jgi:dolichyl-phosphate beta-glucosyltransferase